MGIVVDLKQHKLWAIYERHILRLGPILSAMSAAGMPLDEGERKDFAKDLHQQLKSIDEQIQQVIPPSLVPVSPPQGYVRRPASTEGLTEVLFDRQVKKVCSSCGQENPKKPHFKIFKRKENPCGGSTLREVVSGVSRWAKILPFVPSPKGILTYAHFHRHSVPTGKASKGARKETTDEKALLTLARKYPTDLLYPLLLKRRELDKLRGTYVGHYDSSTGRVVGGFPVGADGCVHTTFTHTPSTLRLASENPNLQNVPRADTDLGRRFRGCFRAPTGWTFVARDYTGIEAVLVGVECASGPLTRLARLGVHDYLNAHLLLARGVLTVADVPDLRWEDRDLRECLTQLKRRFASTRLAAKQLVHGGNYAETPFKMWFDHPELFESEAAAAKMRAFYYELFPEIPQWHERICRQVHQTGYARNAFGYVHRFFKVIPWEKTAKGWEGGRHKRGTLQGQLVFEDDAKRLIAFGPQSTAAGIIKEAAIRADEMGLLPMLRLIIHDELLGMCPTTQAEEILEKLRMVMEAPVEQIPLNPEWKMGSCLSMLTEGKMGETWRDLQ